MDKEEKKICYSFNQHSLRAKIVLEGETLKAAIFLISHSFMGTVH